jgi:RNA polymerase sigma-B factor
VHGVAALDAAIRRALSVMTVTMTATPSMVSDIAAAVAAVGSPSSFVEDPGRSRSVAVVARTGGHAGALAARTVGDALVQDLLRRRANLPAGHPDRVTLRARSIEAGLPLARRLAGSYRGRGEPVDDLYQVAALALIKAVDGYDPDRQTAFTTYAVPTILGALKRHFRDSTWRIRVPRSIHNLAVSLAPATAALAQHLGRTPTTREIAAHLGATDEDLALAVNAWHAHSPASLDAPTPGDGPDRSPLSDLIGAVDTRFDAVTDLHVLRPLLAALPVQQRRILAMRFFDNMTQAQIAARIGVSQMHISRLLLRALTRLRTGMLAEQHPDSHLERRRTAGS